MDGTQRFSRIRFVHVVLAAGVIFVVGALMRAGGSLPRETDNADQRATRNEAGARVDVPPFEGVARGFPALRALDGAKLADGDFVQWLDNGRLHVEIAYDFGDGRTVEETAVLRQRPQLAQEDWSFREVRDGELFRQFEVSFASGTATARKRDEGDVREWSEDVDIEPGRTFAGFGFTLAVKALRDRLVEGEEIELQAVAFTPRPRVVSVAISHGGLEQMRMGDRLVRGNRFAIRPRIPWIARLFVTVPETQLWLTHPTPAAFLRWEGPLAEPDDASVRVDLLPGRESSTARPVETSGR